MKILDLEQGSDQWLEARLNYLCASEAPVVMGESKFMSRKQLLALKKGWKSNPVDSFKQRLFDKGHENEAAARELLEFDLCEDLPSVVGLTEVDGLELLASFDGLGEMGYIWEHKDWNLVLAENVRNSVLEPLYYWQLEHQMLVEGGDEVNFMVSDGTMDNRISMVYKSVPERREQLIAGWKQFLVDLDEYEIEAKQEKVVAREQQAFPVVHCSVEGSKVVSNLGDYIPVIQQLAEEQMSVVLETDQDFADKDAFNKNVKEGRASLKLKAAEVEKEFESLAEFNGFVAQADGILQKLQSHGERQVKESKDAKKASIVNDAREALQAHLAKLSEGINSVQIHGVTADWPAVIKGKRSFEKMQEAVDSELANLKVQANELASVIRANLDTLSELAGEHRFLFSDHAELITKDNDDLVNLIKMRIAEHEKAEEQRREEERKRIQQEEEAKATKAAEEKAATEREEIRKEERAKAEAEKEAEKPAPKAAPKRAAAKPATKQDPVVDITIEVPESKRSAVISLLMDQMAVEVVSDSLVKVK